MSGGGPAHVVLHVGAHKTATTHLQKSFYRSRAALAEAGVTFLGPDEMRGGILSLPAIMRFDGGMDALRAEVRGRLARICGDRPVLVISEENIPGVVQTLDIPREGRFYPRAVARLSHLVQALGGRVRLCLGVREPAAFLVSAWAQRLMGGQHCTFADYIGDCDPAALSWTEYAERLLSVPGVTGLAVWRHEDYPALRDDVAQALCAPVTAPIRWLDKRVHAGLSAPAAEAVQAAIREGRAGEKGLVQGFKKAFPKEAGAPDYDPWPPERRAAARRAYADDVARLANLPGVVLLRPDA